MKKILVMSALVAFSAAFVACSNENDLVQQKPDVPETPTERYPITVTVSDPTSRGTDLTADDLTSFSMYSTIDESWQANVNSNRGAGFEKISGSWRNTTSSEMSWPSTTNEYTFYALNDVANMTSAPTVTEENVSFGYAMPQKLKENTTDVYYYDYADQVDLLVAKKTAKYTDGNPNGSINVTFQHALAQITAIKVYCDASKLKPAEVDKWFFRVNGIKIGGLKAVGTYTFDATKPWAVDTSAPDAEFEIPLDETQLTFDNMKFVPSTKTDADNVKVLPLKTGDEGLYIIPQAVSGSVSYVNNVYVVNGAYAELELQGMMDETANSAGYVFHLCSEEIGTIWDEESSEANGFQRVRVPLTFDISGGSGKGYTLIIDITNAVVIEDTDNSNRYEGDLALGGSLNFQV